MKYPSKGDLFGIDPNMKMNKSQARGVLLQNKDRGMCAICEMFFNKQNLEAVLIIPKSEEGLEVYSKYQLACSACAREVKYNE